MKKSDNFEADDDQQNKNDYLKKIRAIKNFQIIANYSLRERESLGKIGKTISLEIHKQVLLFLELLPHIHL